MRTSRRIVIVALTLLSHSVRADEPSESEMWGGILCKPLAGVMAPAKKKSDLATKKGSGEESEADMRARQNSEREAQALAARGVWSHAVTSLAALGEEVDEAMKQALAKGEKDPPAIAMTFNSRIADLQERLKCAEPRLTVGDRNRYEKFIQTVIEKRREVLASLIKPKPPKPKQKAAATPAKPKGQGAGWKVNDQTLGQTYKQFSPAVREKALGVFDPLGSCEREILQRSGSTQTVTNCPPANGNPLTAIAGNLNQVGDTAASIHQGDITPMSLDELRSSAAIRLASVAADRISRREAVLAGQGKAPRLGRLQALVDSCKDPGVAREIGRALAALKSDARVLSQKDQAAAKAIRDAQASGQSQIFGGPQADLQEKYLNDLLAAAQRVDLLKSANLKILEKHNSAEVFGEPDDFASYVPCVPTMRRVWNAVVGPDRAQFEHEKGVLECALANEKYRGVDGAHSLGIYAIYHNENVPEREREARAARCAEGMSQVRSNLAEIAALTGTYDELLQNVQPQGRGNASLAHHLAAAGPHPEGGGPTRPYSEAERENLLNAALQGNARDSDPRDYNNLEKYCQNPDEAVRAAYLDPSRRAFIFDCHGDEKDTISDKECARMRHPGTLALVCDLQKKAAEGAGARKLGSDVMDFASMGFDAHACVNLVGGLAKSAYRGGVLGIGRNLIANGLDQSVSGFATGVALGGGMSALEYYSGKQAADDASMRLTLGVGTDADRATIQAHQDAGDIKKVASNILKGMAIGGFFNGNPKAKTPWDRAVHQTRNGTLQGKVRRIMAMEGNTKEWEIANRELRSVLEEPLLLSGKISPDDVHKLSNEALLGLWEGTVEGMPKVQAVNDVERGFAQALEETAGDPAKRKLAVQSAKTKLKSDYPGVVNKLSDEDAIYFSHFESQMDRMGFTREEKRVRRQKAIEAFNCDCNGVCKAG